MRRVVIGTDTDGRARVASDEDLPWQQAGGSFASIWESDGTMPLPSDGSLPPSSVAFWPPPGGVRIIELLLPPQESGNLPETLPGGPEAERAATMADGIRKDEGPPLMHASDSVDVLVVLAGDVFLLLDTGEEIHLHEGDWTIQNGAFHAWSNRGSAPCRMGIVIFGAHLDR